MAATSLLFAGTGLVFVGLAVGLVMLLRSSAPATGAAKSLLVIEQMHLARSVQRHELPSAPVPVPWVDRFVALGRRITPVGTPARLQRRLDLAGNPTGWSVERLIALKGVTTLVGGGLALLFLLSRRSLLTVGLAVFLVVMGYWVVDILLYNSGLKRQQKIQKTLPDALDLLMVCVEAGLGFDAALAHVARNTNGPISGEFARILQEMQIGKPRTQAFGDFTSRTTVPEAQVFVSALVQSDRMGIPIANVLREQANEMRVKRRQRAEEQAQKVPVKILFPLIFCIFPALFVVILGPAAIQIYRTLFGGAL